MLMNYTLRFVLLIFIVVYFITAQECTGSLSFRDASKSFTVLWVSRKFVSSIQGSHFTLIMIVINLQLVL